MNKQSFEEALKTLEEIVQALENGELPLEEAVKKYEEGMALSQHCHKLLEQAEKVLTKVIKDQKEEDFEITE
ncbi:MAG: exodeoxyribonuclease VII small subunit [Candidatus Izemoplasmataceae bacterium]|jgi:exodeoxyribonuclease VII small subunit|uniref:exodeoxyribonuclease VII small subunit n=1 Tax=Liberiplasma polymorphum TaxID=3374570 RepID=UPI003774B364